MHSRIAVEPAARFHLQTNAIGRDALTEQLGPQRGGEDAREVLDRRRVLRLVLVREHREHLADDAVVRALAEASEPDHEGYERGQDELRAWHLLVHRVALAGEAAAHVQLCGCHPSHARLSSPTRRANRVMSPSSTRCSVAALVDVEADELDVRHREDAAAHLDQVLLRDAGLVDLDPDVHGRWPG